MHLSPLIAGCCIVIAATATADLVSARNHTDADPFHLVLISIEDSLDGESIETCYAGAALEVPCLLGKARKGMDGYVSFPTFFFSSTAFPVEEMCIFSSLGGFLFFTELMVLL
jgi:hypothetical protein